MAGGTIRRARPLGLLRACNHALLEINKIPRWKIKGESQTKSKKPFPFLVSFIHLN